MKRKTDTVLPFRLSYEDRAALSELAKAKGKTLSSTVRGIVQSNEEVSSMRNVVTRQILDQMSFVGDQGKAQQQPGIVDNLRGYANALPCSRNNVFYPGGIAQIEAQQAAKTALKQRGYTDEMIEKQMSMGMPDFVPGGVTSWQALDEWRTAAHVATQMQESADAMNAMMSNVINDPALEGKGKLLKDLADGFAMRVASLPKTKERSKDQTTLAHVRKLAELYSGIDAIKAILGE